ncbi:apelin receptor A-like [Platysternon megacephalum]|uniref:Apelin receptor A-like n=1 Tax=Platysternon megacephalum TaxID=55544 RepID=A0A4D9DU58_9SAUR|nr:apelin receptor A-like [Platysternon megacephalum]
MCCEPAEPPWQESGQKRPPPPYFLQIQKLPRALSSLNGWSNAAPTTSQWHRPVTSRAWRSSPLLRHSHPMVQSDPQGYTKLLSLLGALQPVPTHCDTLGQLHSSWGSIHVRAESPRVECKV